MQSLHKYARSFGGGRKEDQREIKERSERDQSPIVIGGRNFDLHPRLETRERSRRDQGDIKERSRSSRVQDPCAYAGSFGAGRKEDQREINERSRRDQALVAI